MNSFQINSHENDDKDKQYPIESSILVTLPSDSLDFDSREALMQKVARLVQSNKTLIQTMMIPKREKGKKKKKKGIPFTSQLVLELKLTKVSPSALGDLTYPKYKKT